MNAGTWERENVGRWECENVETQGPGEMNIRHLYIVRLVNVGDGKILQEAWRQKNKEVF